MEAYQYQPVLKLPCTSINLFMIMRKPNGPYVYRLATSLQAILRSRPMHAEIRMLNSMPGLEQVGISGL